MNEHEESVAEDLYQDHMDRMAEEHVLRYWEGREASVINEICVAARERYGDNAVEAMVGALSSVCEPRQLIALLTALRAPTEEGTSPF